MRRIVLLLVVCGAAAVAVMRWREQPEPALTGAAPQWPPLRPVPDAATHPAGGDSTWRTATADGGTPEGFPIKAKDSSKIFHVPGGRFYDRTKPERCYATAAHAEADGYRPSKS